MATRNRTPPAAALSRPDDIHHLLAGLLDVIGHFQLADQYLQAQFAELPEHVQPAATVLHRATQDLNRLHSQLDTFSATHVCRARTDADREAAAASCSRDMTPEERDRFRESLGLPAEVHS